MKNKKFHKRFWSKVLRGKKRECWEWNAGLDLAGYGRFWDGAKMALAYRVSFVMRNGEIKDGLEIHHICKNRRCVNPFHLEAITRREHARKNIKLYCSRCGSLREPIVFNGPQAGRLDCRKCKKLRAIESYNRHRKSRIRRAMERRRKLNAIAKDKK